MESNFEEREELFEQYLNYDTLKAKYQSGQLKGLDKHERNLLEFCHGRDMHAYLQENVGDKPIVLNRDGSVNWGLTKFKPEQEKRESLYEVPQTSYPQEYQQPYVQHPVMQPISEQKFYYLYDDDGNLIAAIPKK